MSTQRNNSGPSRARGKQQMPVRAQDPEDRNLYVTRIWPGANISALRNYFSNFGDVVNIRRRSADIAVVTFASPFSVVRALSFLSHTIDGHPVEIRKLLPDDRQIAQEPFGIINTTIAAKRTKKIFVGGLDISVKGEDLWKYFQFYGNVTGANVVFDRATKRSKCYGFVSFDSADVVDEILKFGFHQFNRKRVYVRRCLSLPRRNQSNVPVIRTPNIPPRPRPGQPVYNQPIMQWRNLPRPPSSVDLCFPGYRFNGVFWEPPPWTAPPYATYINQGHGGYYGVLAQRPHFPYNNPAHGDISSCSTNRGGIGTTQAGYQGTYQSYGGNNLNYGNRGAYERTNQAYVDRITYSNLNLSHTNASSYGVSQAPCSSTNPGDRRSASLQASDNLELAAEIGLPDDLY